MQLPEGSAGMPGVDRDKIGWHPCQQKTQRVAGAEQVKTGKGKFGIVPLAQPRGPEAG